MKTFMFTFGLVLGIALSAASIWFLDQRTLSVTMVRAREEAKNVAAETTNFAQAKADSLDLSTTNIKAELDRAGAIVRRKAADAGQVIADAAADTRITTTIKGKLVADVSLSALSISVSTTDGLVTMSGAASSPENIQKAIQLAWDTDGVRGVVSTIQVKD